MVTHVAVLDVPRHVVERLARLPAAHRRRIGTPKNPAPWERSGRLPWCCAGSASVAACTAWPAMPGSPRPPLPARRHRRPDRSDPDPHDVPKRCQREAMTHVVLDGMLIACGRGAGVRGNGDDLWFSRKHKSFGGNVQFLFAPDGIPSWISEVEPGSTPDIVAARIHVPVRRPKGHSEQALPGDIRMRSTLVRHVRALGEHTAAEPKERWRALKHVTLSPSRIGDIARAALVLNGHWK